MKDFSTSVLFGVAYYDEYMPHDRIDQDMKMMRDAGINVIRIAESTWSTLEPQQGAFDFRSIDRMLDAAERHGLAVIVGTPTYAVPSWLTALYPDILADTHSGRRKYGARQIMNIDHAAYLYHCEKVIRALLDHVHNHPNVIGYQVDNETKYFDVTSPSIQRKFVKHLRVKFDGDLSEMNRAFGLDYWSNRVDAWEDFPDVSDTINGSLGAEFDVFRRSLVTEFLAWQAAIIREYSRPDQFVTHNFDLAWRGHSHGIQVQVDHFKAAEGLDVAGVDIYHPSARRLTGKEIAFGGDLTRSLKFGKNYLVLETEAQGNTGWLPFPGQLRLQGMSHLASGANSVMYWHWHSIHNSFETYWRGLLSHDLESNPTYEEAKVFGQEIARIGPKLVNLRKSNQVAVVVSNESLTALKRFAIETGYPVSDLHSDGQSDLLSYNDVVRWMYDALFELNVEADFLPADAGSELLAKYKMIITPSLYCAGETTTENLRGYVADGGMLLSTFRSFVADPNVTVWDDRQPHGLTDVFGIHYNQFTVPDEVALEFAPPLSVPGDEQQPFAEHFMELLDADASTTVLARYDYWAWENYAAITRNRFGLGHAEWVGTMLDKATTREVLANALDAAGVDRYPDLSSRVRMRKGVNDYGTTIVYYFNYSDHAVETKVPFGGVPLASSVDRQFVGPVGDGEVIELPRWGFLVLEGEALTSREPEDGPTHGGEQ